HLPPGWWHHIEMLPSPADEVVSINFWYPPPTWFHGNLAQGEIDWDRPLYGVRRMLFQRCVEELVAQMADPSKVQQILELAVQESPSGPVDQSLKQ
ncbi:hif1an, partial [Symbiodinium necroappetens]